MAFITEDFLLSNSAARRLYHTFAEPEPILDYHCHLPPREIAENRRFRNLTEIWLDGDHYKWRAMRANGVDERYCTGDAEPFEKFLAWARTAPFTLRNPLYHWTHLELKRYFGIEELLNESTARGIWDRANERLRNQRAFDAGHSGQVPCQAAVHHRRPGGRSGVSPRHSSFSDVPRACFRPFGRTERCKSTAGEIQRLGRSPGGREQHRNSRLEQLHGCAEAAARCVPLAGRAAFRSRPGPLLREIRTGTDRRKDFRSMPRGPLCVPR